MRSTKGIIVEMEEDHVILLTRGGGFRRLPWNKPKRIGEEVTFNEPSKGSWWVWAAAALLLLFFCSSFLLQPSGALAYVTIDINPSLEMVLDRDSRLVSWRGLDTEGDGLTQSLTKGMPFEDALESILQMAVSLEYIDSAESDNVVLASLYRGDDQCPTLDYLEDSISNAMVKLKVEGSVGVAPVSKELRDEAVDLGLSPNKCLLLKEAAKMGVELEPQELNGPIGKVLRRLPFPPGQVFRERSIKHRPASPKSDREGKGSEKPSEPGNDPESKDKGKPDKKGKSPNGRPDRLPGKDKKRPSTGRSGKSP